MKKRIAIPASLSDYNSLRSPILSSFLKNVIFFTDKNQEDPQACSVGLNNQKRLKMIDPAVLKKYGGKEIDLETDDVIFRQSEEASNYFQLASGSVKMVTDTPEGREFIQGIFNSGDSFGEPPLFCSFPYPSTAIALQPTSIIKLSKDRFFKLLSENFKIHLDLDKVLCDRLKYKSMVLSEISSYDPEHRIASILRYLKDESRRASKRIINNAGTEKPFIVPFTRQQIADMSGLRVETVIRTVRKMKEEGKLHVVSRKIAL